MGRGEREVEEVENSQKSRVIGRKRNIMAEIEIREREKVRRKLGTVSRVEGIKDRKRDGRKIELSRKEICETIGICLETNESKDIGDLNSQTQWKIAKYMKSKNKENKRLGKKGTDEEKKVNKEQGKKKKGEKRKINEESEENEEISIEMEVV